MEARLLWSAVMMTCATTGVYPILFTQEVTPQVRTNKIVIYNILCVQKIHGCVFSFNLCCPEGLVSEA